MSAEPFNTLGGYSVGIPPELVIDETGNVVNNVNAPNSNVTANRIFANSYLYANGDPLSIGASGSNTQVQYNNNGLLGASSAFTFNSSTSLLTVSKLQASNSANLGNVSNVIILGGTNGYFLQTDGAGNLTWAPAGNGGNTGNGVPGGANTQVQFNDAGNFAGDAGFTYNKVSNTLSIANTISAGNAITGVNLSVTDATIYSTLSVTDILASNITLSANITNANWINASYFAGNGHNLFGLVGANVSGQVAFANVANNVAGANVTGQVGFANVANNVAGANVSGQVANALVAGTVYTAAQPNITGVGNLTSLTVVGNTTLGNQVTSNYFIGNLFGTANLARYVTFANQPNITSVGTLTSLSVSGNTTLGNATTSNYFIGNLYGVANNAIVANTANLATHANTANFANTAELANNTLYSNTANIANVAYSVDGSNVVGNVASATTAGTVTTAAQPNITSLGSLTSLTVIGNITSGNITSNFIGNGSKLTNIAGGNVVGAVANATYAVTAGSANTAVSATSATTAVTVTSNAQPNIESVGTLSSLAVSGNITAGNITSNFIGNGSKLTNIPGSNVTGVVANATYAVSAGSANSAANATYANTAGTVTTAAQPNITSVGNLSSLTVDSNIVAGNVKADTGFVRASYLVGPLSTAAQPNITSLGTLSSLNVNGSANLGSVANLTITGGNNGFVLSTDGTGNLSWVAQANGGGSNGTPAGSNTQLQYNDAGNFGASGNLTWNNTTKNFFVGGNANIENTLTASVIKSNVATGTSPFVVESTTPVANLGVATAGTVRTNAQPNITSVGTLTTLAVSGNISGANVQGGNLVSANYFAGTLTTASQPNVTSLGTLTGLGVNGTLTAVNITANTGVITGNANGLTNIPGANVTGIVANANYSAFAGNATNATTATTATTAGTVTTNAQPNITSLGTLSSLNVTGNVLAGNLNANNVVLSSNGAFFGNAAGLDKINASNLTTGTVPGARLSGSYDISVTAANTAAAVTTNAQPNITSVGTLTGLGVNGTLTATNITANTGVFSGNANGLTNIPAGNIVGSVANANYAANAGNAINATNATTATTAGTVTINAQPNITSLGNLSHLNVTGNVLAGNLTANNVVTSSNGAFYGNGAGLTNINAASISSGILSTARLSGSYDISVTDANTAETVTNSSQPNITSVGTLTSLAVNGTANLGTVANVKIAGGTNGYVLQTDGTGNLSWTAQTGGNGNGNPGGATTQIQYNQDGNFAGSPNLSWTNSTNYLYVGGNATITGYVNVTALTSNVSTGTAPFTVYSTTPVANLGVATAGTVRINAQPNITSVGTLTGLTVNGNITTNNITVENTFTTTGNIVTPANIFANNGTIRATTLIGTLGTGAQPNITSVGTLTSLSVGGNVSAGNINAGNLLTANFISGTLTTNAQANINYLGNIGWLNVDTSLPNANGNITFNGSLRGIGTGSNIVITGNLTAANYVEANLLIGTLTTSAQPNVRSLGTLTGLTVNGVSNLGNAGNVKITGGTNGYVLSTDGTGNLTWIAQSNGGGGNGTPGGSNTQIQFNNNGNFGGSPDLTYNDVTNALVLNGNATINGNVSGAVITSTVVTGTAPFVVNSTTPVANLAVDTAGTVRNAAQPNITSLGTLTNLAVTGNVTVGNITVDNTFTTSGNIITSANIFANNGTVKGNLLTGTLTTAAQPNITSVGNLTTLNVVGNVSAGNVAGGNIVTANYLTGTLTTNLQPNINQVGTLGYLNVDTSIANSNGNIRFNGSITGNGAASNITITGNVNAGNYVQAELLIGTLTTSSQPNITTLGNLSSLTVLGNSNLGSVGNIKITGGTANYVLSTDGLGNLSWVAQSGGGGNSNPGGPNTSLQFNDGGVLNGVTGLTYNKTTSNLFLNGNANVTGQLSALAIKSTVATGSPPLQVNSTTPVANLAVESADVVRNASQPNITSVGTLTSLAVAGNITGNNLTLSNMLSAGNMTTTGTIGTTNLNVTGQATLTGNTQLGNTLIVPTTRLFVEGNLNANGSPNVTLGNISNIHIFGGINGYYLQTDGAGNLTWAPASGGGGNGNPGGANTQIQYNDAGDFNGSPSFTFNKVSNVVTINNANIINANTTNLTANTFTAGNISANNISATNLSGNGANVTNVAAVTANVAFSVSGSNVVGEVAFANVANNVAGVNVSGQVGNALVAGTVYTNAQPNITSVGILTSLSVTGNASVGNISAGIGSFTGNVSAANISGGNLVTANFLQGTLVTGAQPNITSIGTLSNLTVTGNIFAGNIEANGGTVDANVLVANVILGSIGTPNQPNITQVGTLTSLIVSGNTATGNLSTTGTVNANALVSNTLNVSSNANVGSLTSTNLTVSGNALVTGNLTVNGNLIYINVETLAVEDPIIELQVGPNGNPPVANSGKDVGTALNYFDTDARKAFMGWDVSGQEFIMAARSEINNEVVTVLQFGNLHIGNIIGNGQALTGLNASNIVGIVPFANNATTANTVVNNAQPNITSVGTLNSLQVTGNISAGNAVLGNAVNANYFVGNGYYLTDVQIGNAVVANANFAAFAGNVTVSSQPNITSIGTLTGLTVNGISNLGSNANVKISGGALGQVLGSDGAGNLTWLSATGVPGGANRAIQYNDDGVFGGSSFLTFNDVTETLQISGNLIANTIQMGAGAYDFSVSNVYFATTSSAASNQTILSIPVSGLAAVDYTIISTDGAIRNFVKISVVRSGTSVNYVEYSSLPVNGYTGDFTVAYSAGNIITPASIVLKFSPQTANLMTHKMMITTYKE